MKTELILLGNKKPNNVNADVIYDYTKPNMSNYGSLISLIQHIHKHQLNDNTQVICIVSDYNDVSIFVDDEIKTINDFAKNSAYTKYIKFFKAYVYQNKDTINDYNKFYLHAIDAVCKSNNLPISYNGT